MKNKSIEEVERNLKQFTFPYHIGAYLCINAISDAVMLVDGPNCSIPKAEYIYGNHDLNSTLFSQYGEHRLFYTMSHPLAQNGNPEHKIGFMLKLLANSGKYGIVFVSGLPFQALAGIDYGGIADSVKGRSPVVAIAPKSLEYGWLGGYAVALESLAYAIPVYKGKKEKNTVAIIGYLFDRNEGDHKGNIRELKRLLELCGIGLVCVFPEGDSFADLCNATKAQYIVSLPYGRKAASVIAGRSGATLIETNLPVGFSGTTEWLTQICDKMGIDCPDSVINEGQKAKRQYLRAASILRHKPVVYAGDPYLFEALSPFLEEMLMRPETAIFDCEALQIKCNAKRILFQPSIGEAAAMVKNLVGYDKPAVLIGNSFSQSEKIAPGLSFIELGFPSYSHHCFTDEPFMGYQGALNIAERLINSQMRI